MAKLTDKKEEEKPLKPEWVVFCHEYVKHWNQTDSYLIAYPKSTRKAATSSASELLTNPNIIQYCEKIQENMQKLSGISMLSNINHLKDILEAETETEIDGKKIATKSEATKDRISALKTINEMLGFNAPTKSEIDHGGGVTIFEIPDNGRNKKD